MHTKILNEFIFSKVTTKNIEAGKNQSKTMRYRGKHYDLYHIDIGLLYKNVTAYDIRAINSKLHEKTKINFYGASTFSFVTLIKKNEVHLKGLYVILI